MLFRPNADYRILEYVLDRDPSLALYEEKRFSGSQSLLQRLCNQWASTIKGQRSASSVRSNSDGNGGNSVVLSHEEIRSDNALCNQWAKLVLTVRAVHRIAHGTATKVTEFDEEVVSNAMKSDELQRFPPRQLSFEIPELHMAMQLPFLPPGIVCQFIELYPEQASLPIENVIQSTNNLLDNEDPGEGRESHLVGTPSAKRIAGKMLPLHFFLSDYSAMKPTPNRPVEGTGAHKLLSQCQKRAGILRGLVGTFPRAATLRQKHQCCDRGVLRSCRCFPIHVAIARGIPWECGLRELVYANPSGLSIRDECGTKLLPFLQQALAAATCYKPLYEPTEDGDRYRFVCKEESNLSVFNTIYCLLRENPSVLTP
ncbi:unnamed protein product [Pseudo-nitzschia multistriata]|uniref:Uncharacterized protein n=1 Tax=Pseudo-nitzschia multistriata TaxID=183589 RepID=A0A448ZTI4_9STRA|nr:unnamed protein product [Pseudo-nitzschia multistriata]